MKLLTVLGARPQFIKAAAVSRALANNPDLGLSMELVHTGQHHDQNMSAVFFQELQIPAPDYHLGVSGGSHAQMTGQMLIALDPVLEQVKPDAVMVYGDTNSTLAGALCAAKRHLPVIHVEAGLRSFNRQMPEELNRILTDQLSDLLFCPTSTAVEHLRSEGITEGVYQVGDVMFDVALHYREQARAQSQILKLLQLEPGNFALVTCHRAENTDHRERLAAILGALQTVAASMPVVLPLHPRTNKQIEQFGLSGLLSGLVVVEPLPFLDMVALEQAARIILTDSGGVQKEAYFYQVPCITLREETEWVETVSAGWNQLAGASHDAIVQAFRTACDAVQSPRVMSASPYGDGDAAHRILSHTKSWLELRS